MIRNFFIFSLVLFSFCCLAKETKKNVKYEYKKYEKFDFEEIGVEGDSGIPGDLSISSRLRNEFKNKLPERKNFNKEMIEGINSVR